MHIHHYITWLGSLSLEVVLVFSILRHGIQRRFPVFFSYILFDIIREIVLPFTYFLSPQRSNNYYYAYWISVPIEYTLTFFIVLEVFAYIFRAHMKISRSAIHAFIGFGIFLFITSLILIFRPDIPTNTISGIILTLNRSISLLMSGLLFFMWAYSSRIGFTMRDHVWGIVFGLGFYSSISLIAAAIHATTGRVRPGILAALPHLAYLASTVIWNLYLFREEPEVPPLTDEELAEYFNLIRGYRTLLANVRKALAR
jgi:hypothetical protein